MLCLIVGFSEGKKSTPGNASDVGRTREIVNEEGWAMMYGMALTDSEFDLWRDPNSVLRLAEEYAAGGLEILAAKRELGVKDWVASQFYQKAKPAPS